MVGFRNVIAHNYENINYDMVYEVLHKGVVDIEEFMERIGGVRRYLFDKALLIELPEAVAVKGLRSCVCRQEQRE